MSQFLTFSVFGIFIFNDYLSLINIDDVENIYGLLFSRRWLRYFTQILHQIPILMQLQHLLHSNW